MVTRLLTFRGRAKADEYLRVFGWCQLTGLFAMCLSLGIFEGTGWPVPVGLGLHVLAQLPAVAAATRRGHDAGYWPVLLIVPSVLFLPATLAFMFTFLAAVAPNHPWWYLHALSGFLATSAVCATTVLVLGLWRSLPSANRYGPEPREAAP